jgi:prevent-host-death family protein
LVEQVDVMTLRKDLSSLLDRTANGERFEVTKRGKAVAHLVPPDVGPRGKEMVYRTPDTSSEAQEIQRRRDALLKSINARGAPK